MQRIFDEEFYQCTAVDLQVETLMTALHRYERTYNTIRPHQALDYRTRQQCRDAYQEAG
jgi:transposase InsO family protein